MSSSRVAVVLALVACVVALSEARTVVLQDNEVKPAEEGIPKVHVGADGVSASFGGYSASAGLGGQLGGSSGASGGLYARAGLPDGTGASAGLGGSLNNQQADGSIHAQAGAGSIVTPNHQGIDNQKIRPNRQSFYNDIFNIPTSILGAVNRLLNGGMNAVANVGANSNPSVRTGAAAGGVNQGVGAHAQVGVTHGSGVGTSTGLLNDIFNIPITALNAVNQLLNNKNGK